MNSFFQGMAVGAGLIIAIGAQNSFVLTQGIRRKHRALVASVCSLSDILLIFAGVAGVGAVIATNVTFRSFAAWGGAAFLFWYGLKSLVSAVKGGVLLTDNGKEQSWKIVLTTALAFTFLNPHVYLDTVVLIGGISAQYNGNDRYLFATGAGLSSLIWFFLLAYGASFLAPLFRKQIAWRILDTIVCLVMWIIAIQLLSVNL